MKHLLFAVSVLFLIAAPYGRSQEFAFPLGAAGLDLPTGLIIEDDGSAVVTGIFEGTLDFDPGPGVTTLSTQAITDSFIAKYDSNGALQFALALTASSEARLLAATRDAAGNIIVCGGFTGTMDLDPTAGVMTANSGSQKNGFIVKLSSSGAFQWAKVIAGSDQFRFEGRDLAASPSGVIVVTGSFSGTGDFDPGAASSELTGNLGVGDGFILTLDSNGNFVRAIKTPAGVLPLRAEFDALENLYLCGRFNAPTDFDFGAGTTTLTPAGSEDGFILKLDSSGAFVWARRFGGSDFDVAVGLSIRGGDLVAVGGFSGSASFDTGAGSTTLTSVTGAADAFVAKFDLGGSLVWLRQLGGSGSDIAVATSIDSAGAVYTIGAYNNVADFDPSAGVFNLPVGGESFFLSKLNSSGDFVFARGLKTSNRGDPGAIHAASDGSIWVAGSFYGTADIGLSATPIPAASAGLSDIYLTRFIPAPIALPQSLSTPSGTPLPVTLAFQDAIPSGVTFTVLTQPASGTLSGAAPNLTYTPTATFIGSDSFTFKVNDGTIDSIAATITINVVASPPVFDSGPLATPNPAAPGESVQFAVAVTDAQTLAYAWNFGDGSTGTGANPAHVYTAKGEYAASVTVTDAAGTATTGNVLVKVSGKPAARFTTTDIVAFENVPFGFDASFSTDPENSVLGYAWDFGDGTDPGSGQIVSKIYTQQGSYTVTLTITDSAGQTATASRVIEVLDASQVGLFNSDISYTVKWDRLKTSTDSLSLTAKVNVGDITVGVGSTVGLTIAGSSFSGTLDKRLQDKSNKNVAWAVKAGTKRQRVGEVSLSVKIKKADLGLGFNQAGAVVGTDPKEDVVLDIPVQVQVAGRVFELSLNSEFSFSKTGTKAKGSGEGP